MDGNPAPNVMKHLAALEDPRVVGRTEHKLFDILFISIATVIADCDGMVKAWRRGDAGRLVERG